MKISIVVAMGHKRVIGVNNQIPWHLPADLKFFKAITMGKPIIMGRKTYESIGHPLPGRTNIVITRNKDWMAEGVVVVHSLSGAIAAAEKDKADEAMIIGGAQIYDEALAITDRLYITEVDTDTDGDTFFPEIGEGWSETNRIAHPAEGAKPAYAFVTLER